MSRRWWCLAALTTARAAIGFQFQSVAAVGPLFAASLSMDMSQLGWLIGLYLLPGAVFALPGALLGRRFGDKRVALLGLALMTVGGVWLCLSRSFAEANVARSVSGVGAVMLNVLVTKMVFDWFDGKERLLAMSVLINSWPVGIGLALLVVAPLGESAGWPWGLFSSAVLAGIGFVAVWAIYGPPADSKPSSAPGLGLRALTTGQWQLLLLSSLPWLLYNAAFQIMMSFMPTFFVENGLALSRAAAYSALCAVAFVAGVQTGGIALKRSQRPDLVCYAAISIWCVALLMLADKSAAVPWILVAGLIGGLPAAALVSLPAEILPAESRNAGMGVFYTVYYLGCAVLPALAGVLYDRTGGGATLWMAAVLAAACIPSLAEVRRRMRASERLAARGA